MSTFRALEDALVKCHVDIAKNTAHRIRHDSEMCCMKEIVDRNLFDKLVKSIDD